MNDILVVTDDDFVQGPVLRFILERELLMKPAKMSVETASIEPVGERPEPGHWDQIGAKLGFRPNSHTPRHFGQVDVGQFEYVVCTDKTMLRKIYPLRGEPKNLWLVPVGKPNSESEIDMYKRSVVELIGKFVYQF